MSWPLSQDYNEAIQNPASSFADSELRAGQAVVNALGLPMPRSGNFADVYEFQGANGNKWAVKCFTREVPGLQERYSEISKHLREAKLPFTVDFKYLEQGVRIRGQWFPILKMQWVEGFLLNEFAKNNLDKFTLLEALGQIWLRMAKRLREAGIAHADLQHGNVILVPGGRAASLAVRLIDYDGMFVPALASKKSGEVGHPNYQHPHRLAQGIYTAEVDRLPLLAIACALRALTIAGRPLWDRFDNGDNLLFTEADLRNPGQSALFKELWRLPDAGVHDLVGHMTIGLTGPIDRVPLLTELVSEDYTKPLTAAQEQQVTAILGPGAKVARPVPVAQAIQSKPAPVPVPVRAGAPQTVPAGSLAGAWESLDDDEPVVTTRRRSRGSSMPWLLAAGILAVVVLAGAGFILARKFSATDKTGQNLVLNPHVKKKAKRPDQQGKNPGEKDPQEIEPKEIVGPGPDQEHPKLPLPVYLSQLQEDKVRVAEDWFRKNGVAVDFLGKEWPIQVNGVKSPHALFLHPAHSTWSSVSYRLERKYSEFYTGVTIPQARRDQEDPATPLIFEVWGDGKALWKSQPLSKRGQHLEKKMAVTGVDILELRVICTGPADWAWATWIEPRLIPGQPAGAIVADKKPKTEEYLADLAAAWPHLNIGRAIPMDGMLRLNQFTQIQTKKLFSGPIEITVQARTQKHNIRLDAFNGAGVIFNWEAKPDELRVRRPDGQRGRLESGSLTTARVQPLQANTWYKLRWRITEQGMVISVDDEIVFQESHSNNLSTPAPVLVRSISEPVEVKSFQVRSLAPATLARPDKLPIPMDDVLRTADKKIKDDFKEEFARRKPAERREFASLLLQEATNSLDEQRTKDPARSYLCFEEGRNQAALAFDFPLAFQIIAEMSKVFEVRRPLALKAEAVVLASKFSKNSRTEITDIQVATAALALLDDVKNTDAYLLVPKLRKALMDTSSKYSWLKDARVKKSQIVDHCEKEFESIKAYYPKLKANPMDAEANLAIGKCLCFAKEDWSKGLPLLKLGNAPALAALAEKDLAEPDQAKDQADLGEAWWELAEKQTDLTKAHIRRRAKFWLRRALPKLSGSDKDKAVDRLKVKLAGGTKTYSPGLNGEYFKGENLKNVAYRRIDYQVDFNWGFRSPAPGVPADRFSCCWTGFLVAPQPGIYNLTVIADDGCRLYIDNKPVIDAWKDCRNGKTVPWILTGQLQSLRIEHREGTGSADMTFRWALEGRILEQPVPLEALFH